MEDDFTGFSIEGGYFIFTLMPSLKCGLNCPHCYLSKEQRRSSDLLSVKDLSSICEKVDAFYRKRNLKSVRILPYWYGGEPTEMGLEYFLSAMDEMERIFEKDRGYEVKHTVLTSLLNVDLNVWLPFFKSRCEGYFQSSFDGLMRGAGYVRKWEGKAKAAISEGLEMGTISVVNSEMLKAGAVETLGYLTALGVKESSFLPFMWNEQNDGKAYGKYAPTMSAWSDFMIDLSEEWLRMRKAGLTPPNIGQMSFVHNQAKRPSLANVAAQTLFLLPNGDFVLPDYMNGWQEYMRVFGNGLKSSFEEILSSAERKSYLRKQATRNGNAECSSCDHFDKCVMEFWKENKAEDDCFGGKKYVEWVMARGEELEISGLGVAELY